MTRQSDGAWYEQSFGCDYLELYAHRDTAEARADIEAIVHLLDPPRDEPLLDLCCGACRHLLTLREMGFTQLVGLDLSAELLEVGAACLGQGAGADAVRLVRSDMRSIPYESYFATVLSLFTSFGYFVHDEQNQAVFHAVYRALKPGGKFLIDYLNREYVIANLVEQDECVLGDQHVSNVRCLTDECRRVTKTMTVTYPSGEERVYHESVRMYSETELVAMLRRAGLVNIRTCGSLDGQAYRPESKRLIAVAEKSEMGVNGD